MRPEPNDCLPEPFRGLTDEQLLERWPLAFRFRDEAFVEVWRRWQRARTEWRRSWWSCEVGTPYFFKDEACPDHPVAREFVEARQAYLAELADRRGREHAD